MWSPAERRPSTFDDEMQAKDELLALVFTRVLDKVRFDIEVLLKTVCEFGGDLHSGREWCKVLSASRSEYNTQHFVILLVMLLLTGECSVKIERYPRRPFSKVDEHRCNKSRPKQWGFVLFLFMRRPFNPSFTRYIHLFPYLDITSFSHFLKISEPDKNLTNVYLKLYLGNHSDSISY